jgi:hypothetical protein
VSIYHISYQKFSGGKPLDPHLKGRGEKGGRGRGKQGRKGREGRKGEGSNGRVREGTSANKISLNR